MSETVYLTTPLTTEAVSKLRITDIVYLSGTIYTARDMAHQKIRELVDRNEPLPESFEGAAVYHAGPVVRKTTVGYDLLLIGPTTSIRMEPFSDMHGKLGTKAIIGKGGLGDDSSLAFKKYGMVYLLAAGGCGSLHAQAVRRVKTVHWIEMGMPEAIWVLQVEKWGPLTVTMDSHGDSIHRNIEEEGRKKIDALVKQMA
jgi:fumarate hydratase subunit beta/L(+)-tartrate dehydratase beta subunit